MQEVTTENDDTQPKQPESATATEAWMDCKYSKEDFITGDKFLALEQESKLVQYVKTDALLQKSIGWRGKHHQAVPNQVWLSGHSDYEISQNLYEKYKGWNQVWYATNKVANGDTIHALPIGVTNETNESPSHTVFGNQDHLLQALEEPRSFQNWCYYNVNDATHRGRRVVRTALQGNAWITFAKNECSNSARIQFLKDLRNHRFTICPRGNGIDTHRMWEALYMGSIPIVEESEALSDFKDLPILFVPKLELLTFETVQQAWKDMPYKQWNLNLLKFGTWKERILANCT